MALEHLLMNRCLNVETLICLNKNIIKLVILNESVIVMTSMSDGSQKE